MGHRRTLTIVSAVAVLRLFAAAREAAGRGRDDVPGSDVAAVLATACARYGEPFAAVLARSKVWLNGDPAEPGDAVRDTDEVAVLPPVSGG
jgi:molybdopterin converting factor small subunit